MPKEPSKKVSISRKDLLNLLNCTEQLLAQERAAKVVLAARARNWQAAYAQAYLENYQKREPEFHTLQALLHKGLLAEFFHTLASTVCSAVDPDQ